MLWNLDLISFLFSQKIVRIGHFKLNRKQLYHWTRHSVQSQLERPAWEREVTRYPEKNSAKLAAQPRDGGQQRLEVPASPTATRRVGTRSWSFSRSVHDVCCSGTAAAPLRDASAISYSRLARAARRNAAFVAQHCMAERLQSASSMPVRTH